jgi:hypothetical protein
MTEGMKQLPMTVTFQVPADITDATAERIRKGLEAYASTMSYTRGATVSLPEPESPVSHAPCIQGVIDIAGLKSEFLIPLANDSVGFSQWGAGTPVLWTRVDLLDELSSKAREWADENLCRVCRENMTDDGEGEDGMCGECADRSSCVADCSPDDEELDGPCSECGTDWSKWNGEDHETFRREQREAREQDDNA